MTWASTWKMMNRTLEAFATRNTDSSGRGGSKSRKTFKKPKEFKDDSDGCIDTWVEVMRLHLEQDNLKYERQSCTAILSNLEGTALKCVVAKKEEERDTADKIFEILLNRFGSGMKGHQAMMRFEKRRQRDDESIDRFLDELESLRRKSDPEESLNRKNFSFASRFIDGVESDDLRIMLATSYILSKVSAPTPEEMIQMEEHYFYSGLIIKIGARCFFCNQERHFRMDFPLFWEAVKNQSHPKHGVSSGAEPEKLTN